MTKSENILLTIPNFKKFKKTGIFSEEIFPNDYNWTFNMYKFANGTDIFRGKPFRLHSQVNRIREAKSIHKLKKFKQAINLSRYTEVLQFFKNSEISMRSC